MLKLIYGASLSLCLCCSAATKLNSQIPKLCLENTEKTWICSGPWGRMLNSLVVSKYMLCKNEEA